VKVWKVCGTFLLGNNHRVATFVAMPRPPRIALGGYVYHVLNRANGRLRIFRKDSDFLAPEQILAEEAERVAVPCGRATRPRLS
jgi:hypothetical protein